MRKKLLILGMSIMLVNSFNAMAQQTPIQYFRPNDMKGLNIFETTKQDSIPFTGFKLGIGGNFTQDYQGLSDQNNAKPALVNGVNTNQLAPLADGFNRAMANLNIDAQLEDGIRMNLTMYLSTRHHEETWVKGGYIQFDKLLFLKSDVIDNIMKSITIKIGDYEVDYGDQHFRRSDGGSAIYNPFTENYIMDEFATEIGGEVYYHHKSGLFAMFGITNGEFNPTTLTATQIDSATRKKDTYTPAFHGKLGYDKQLNSDIRVKLTGSFYTDKNSSSNTLFFGDRTGSRYFYVMDNASTASSDANAWTGRFNPNFSQQVTTFMINPFVKYKGLELFGTYELAKGRMITESDMRTTTQYAVDLIYRFRLGKENLWIGGRYNTVKSAIPLVPTDITINRIVGSVGWFITKNIVMKAEYVNQQYKDYASTNILSNGKFDGFMVEATIGF